MNTKVSKEVLDLSDVNPIERLATFAEATAALFDVWPIGPLDQFNATSVGHSVEQLVFNQVQLSPMRVRRDQKHLSTPGSGFLVLEQFLVGEEEIVMPLNKVRLQPGRINLRDWSVGFEGHSQASRTIRSIVIPRQRMSCSAEMGAARPILSWPLETPAGQTLSALWDRLLADLDSVSQVEAIDVVRAFLGYVDALFSSGQIITSASETAKMQRYIEENKNRTVGVSELSDVFHVSRTTLYERFSQVGGVERYGLKIRLDGCYHDLCYADPAVTRVGQVAQAYGFHDASAFNRRFRALFGVAPSRLLGVWHANGTPQDLKSVEAGERGISTTYRDWFRDIAD